MNQRDLSSLPESLRSEVARDHQPVRPLPAVWRGTVLLSGAASGLFALWVTLFSLRPDLGELPLWLTWGCAIVQLALATMLAALALREGIPGRATPMAAVAIAILSALAVQMAVGVATWLHSTGASSGAATLGHDLRCMRADLQLALPIFLLAMVMVFRALPLRAPVAGALAGAAAALASDAIAHLRCGVSDLRHVLVWHTGAIVLMIALGWFVGWLWSRRRWPPSR